MKHVTKIVCFVLVLLSLILCGCTAAQYATDSPSIQSIASGIAGYSLPASYTEQFTAGLFGFQVVSLSGPEPDCHIYLAQAPEGAKIDQDGLRKRAEDLASTSGGGSLPREMRVVETRPVTLRGSETSLVVSEGVDGDGQTYRDASALFTGRGGLALVSISAPVDLWDAEMVEAFLASLE